MKKKWMSVLGVSVLITGLATAAGFGFTKSDGNEVINGTIPVETHGEADFPDLATVSFEQAVQNALASIQGQVLKMELEDENGFLVYGIEIVTADKSIVDVKVDAGSGDVLAMDADDADEHDSGQDRQD